MTETLAFFLLSASLNIQFLQSACSYSQLPLKIPKKSTNLEKKMTVFAFLFSHVTKLNE